MGSDHSKLRMEQDIAEMNRLFFTLIRQGRYLEATDVGRRLWAKTQSVRGPQHVDTLSIMFFYGVALQSAGKYSTAEHVYRQLLPLREKVLGADHLDTISVLDSIADTMYHRRQYEECMKMLDEALRRCEEAFGPKHDLTIKLLHKMGDMYRMQGQPYLASSVLLRALELSESAFGVGHPKTTSIQDDLFQIRPPDSLELRQALAAKHGIPIPGAPFPNLKSITLSELLREYDDVSGVFNGGREMSNALSLRLSELMGKPPKRVAHIPPYYTYRAESRPESRLESSEDESTSTSPPFGSLVERSIKAWKHLGGMTQAIKKHAQVLRHLSSLDDFLVLRDHQYWFFQLRESFMRQKSFQKWDPDRLEDYILIPVEDGFVNEKICVFISHYWRAQGHPDPHGEDLRALQKRILEPWDYFWVDYICMPQRKRTESQQQYFTRTLKSIPQLVRDCTFMWHFPDFQPRLWVLCEVAQFTWNRSRPIPLTDIEPFMDHLREMKGYGVRYVLNRHGYRCTNQSDRELVVGWLEMLLLLRRILPSIRNRLAILNAVDDSRVRSCYHQESGITVDKLKGTITMDERMYDFAPVSFEVTGSDGHVHIEPDLYYEKQLPVALQRAADAPDDLGYLEIGREYDREGEYRIGEKLYWESLANGTSLVSTFLAENLENQGRYKEAEELWREIMTMDEEKGSININYKLEIRYSLARVVQKRKLATYYQRWKFEPLENILELDRPNILKLGQSDAMILKGMDQEAKKLENQRKFNEAKKVLWSLLEWRKENLGPYHLQTVITMCNLAGVLRYEGNSGASERLLWLALAVSDDRRGPEHPNTLAIMSNLAASVGTEAERKEIYRSQLERQLRIVDFDHPDTFTVKFNLSTSMDEGDELRIAPGVVWLDTDSRVEGSISSAQEIICSAPGTDPT